MRITALGHQNLGKSCKLKKRIQSLEDSSRKKVYNCTLNLDYF